MTQTTTRLRSRPCPVYALVATVHPEDEDFARSIQRANSVGGLLASGWELKKLPLRFRTAAASRKEVRRFATPKPFRMTKERKRLVEIDEKRFTKKVQS